MALPSRVGTRPLDRMVIRGRLATTGLCILPFDDLFLAIDSQQLGMAGVQLSLVKTRVRRQNRFRLVVPITQDTTGRNDLPRRSCHIVGLEHVLTIMGKANGKAECVIESAWNTFPELDRLTS